MNNLKASLSVFLTKKYKFYILANIWHDNFKMSMCQGRNFKKREVFIIKFVCFYHSKVVNDHRTNWWTFTQEITSTPSDCVKCTKQDVLPLREFVIHKLSHTASGRGKKQQQEFILAVSFKVEAQVELKLILKTKTEYKQWKISVVINKRLLNDNAKKLRLLLLNRV